MLAAHYCYLLLIYTHKLITHDMQAPSAASVAGRPTAASSLRSTVGTAVCLATAT